VSELTVGIIALFINIGLWLGMYFIQRWESRTGRISARRMHNKKDLKNTFLYLYDFFTNGFVGDWLALSMVDMAVAVSIYQNGFQSWMFLPVLVVAGSLVHFYKMCTKSNHKTDWGFPRVGKISWGGRSHMVYAGIQGWLICIGIIFVAIGQMNLFPLFIAGLAIWVICWLADFLTGRFSSI